MRRNEKARLAAYAITGGERPLPVLLIAGVTALAVLVALVLLLIVVRLVFRVGGMWTRL